MADIFCKEFNIKETVKTAWLLFDAINSMETLAKVSTAL